MDAKAWLNAIHELPLEGTVRIMNVCGGHERAITQAGLRGALPGNIELIPGPGCPVCICPEEAIYAAIQYALRDAAIVVAYGDMLRVPVNGPKDEARSLEVARARGGDIRPIASRGNTRNVPWYSSPPASRPPPPPPPAWCSRACPTTCFC